VKKKFTTRGALALWLSRAQLDDLGAGWVSSFWRWSVGGSGVAATCTRRRAGPRARAASARRRHRIAARRLALRKVEDPDAWPDRTRLRGVPPQVSSESSSGGGDDCEKRIERDPPVGRSSRFSESACRSDCPRQFRIPHSALRIGFIRTSVASRGQSVALAAGASRNTSPTAIGNAS